MNRFALALAGALVGSLAAFSNPAAAQLIEEDLELGPPAVGLADPLDLDDDQTVVEHVVRRPVVERVVETVEEAPAVRRRVAYRRAVFAPRARIVSRRVAVRERAYVARPRVITRRVVVREQAFVPPTPIVERRVVVRGGLEGPHEVVRVRRTFY